MSWFARSLANSFQPDADENGSPKPAPAASAVAAQAANGSHRSETGSPTRGVKEDLLELTKTITRPLWGVASFLAPPPQSPRRGDQGDSSHSPLHVGSSSSSSSSTSYLNRGVGTGSSDPMVKKEEERSDLPGISGVRSDFVEIGGRFGSGISKLSSNKAVSEFSKIGSAFLPFGVVMDEEERVRYVDQGVAIGVTEEVLTFVRNISMHPKTWLDFFC